MSAGAPLAGAKGLHAGFSVLGPSVCALLNSWCLETIKYVPGDVVTNRATPRQTDRGFRNKLALLASHTVRFLPKLWGKKGKNFTENPRIEIFQAALGHGRIEFQTRCRGAQVSGAGSTQPIGRCGCGRTCCPITQTSPGAEVTFTPRSLACKLRSWCEFVYQSCCRRMSLLFQRRHRALA